MPRGFLGAGNFIVDYVKTVDVYPAEQALSNIRGEFTGSGGAPYNVLLALSKLGADVPLAALGRIGSDQAGTLIIHECSAAGMDTSRLIRDTALPTSYTLVMVVEESGRRTFFHQRGANAALRPDDFNFSGLEGWHLHYGYVLLLDGMDQADPEFGTKAARMLATAKEAGLTTSIDLVSEDSQRFRNLVPPALKYADIAFLNEFELARTTDMDLAEVDRTRLCDAHRALGFDGLLVVHWAGGAAACGPDGEIMMQGSVALPPELVKSTVGAGDAFAAGFLLGQSQGLRRALELGVCAAASSVTGFTCTDSIATVAECLELGKRYGHVAAG